MRTISPGKKIQYAVLVLVVSTLFYATLLLAQSSSEVSLEVVVPNGGEFWGGEQVILWNSSGIQKVDIWFSGDDGEQWMRLAENVSSLGGVHPHDWGWDTTGVNDTVYARINVSSVFGYGENETAGEGYGGIFNPTLYYDVSNAPFTIDNTPPWVTNLSADPLFQEAGGAVTLLVSIEDAVGVDKVVLSVQFPDSHWENIPLPVNQTGDLYRYNRSYLTVGIYNYSVWATDRAGNLYQSPWHAFVIEDTLAPLVNLIYPWGGEYVRGEVTIQYNITDNSDASFNESISISYSPDGGLTWLVLAKDLFNTGYYRWNTTQFPDSESYLLRVNATDMGGNWGWGESIASFTLDNTAPQVVIQTPRGGDILPDLITITWQAWDAISPDASLRIDIGYSPDNGKSWTTIVQNISNTGLYVYSTQQWIDNNTYLLQINATDETGNQGFGLNDVPYIKDANPPRVTIARPHEGWIHFRDEQILPFPFLRTTLVIGIFTVEIDAYDYHDVTGIGRIDISVDDILQETLWEEPYQWVWHSTLGRHTLSATAYDYAGNNATATQDIITLTFPY